MTCNVKVVTCSYEPTENYHATLQFPSAPQSVLVPFSSLFWVNQNRKVLVHPHSSHQCAAGSCFERKKLYLVHLKKAHQVPEF